MTVANDVLRRVRALGMRGIRKDTLALGVILVTIVAAWCFLELADEVAEGSTQRFDEWAVRAFRRASRGDTSPGPHGWGWRSAT